jgi:hypothetical protein
MSHGLFPPYGSTDLFGGNSLTELQREMARTLDVDVEFSLELLHVDSDAPRGWLSMLDVVSSRHFP